MYRSAACLNDTSRWESHLRRTLAVMLAWLVMFAAGGVAAADDAAELGDAAAVDDLEGIDEVFTDLSMEELMSIRVTSVAGVEMDWFKTPSAMYVITGEDIRRTGHQSLPEALRLAPGLHVGQNTSNIWSISARGFQHRYANKLLVRIDGRTIYDPYFSGVYWNRHHVLMEDVDRIEVVRGPGATLWGANAVNGVINVTTRNSRDTQGLYLSGVTGSHYHAIASARYGGRIDDDTTYRVWSAHRDVENFDRENGGDYPDKWRMTHGGFRLDREGADGFELTLQGDITGSTRIDKWVKTPDPTGLPMAETRVVEQNRFNGAYMLARISQNRQRDDGWSLQVYHDYVDEATQPGLRAEQHVTDVDFRHHFQPVDNHELVWGAGYRLVNDKIRSIDRLTVDPASSDSHTFTAFIQDTITLVPDRLFTMIGSKFEHNSFTGFEYQPSVRVAWTPNDRQTVWASVSRAVHTPSRNDSDATWLYGYMPFPPPNDRVVLLGNPDLRSESLLAYEAGYRIKLTDTLAIDTAAFINRHRHLITVDPNLLQYTNDGRSKSHGLETTLAWQVADNWRLDLSYSYIHSNTEGQLQLANVAPKHQAHLRSYLDITDDLELNTALYFNDSVDEYDISSYLRWDVGVTWRVTDNMELSLWGQNLLESRHTEFIDPHVQAGRASVPRSFYVQATLRF